MADDLKVADHIIWCDGCQENIYPGQKYDAKTAPGLLLCTDCSRIEKGKGATMK